MKRYLWWTFSGLAALSAALLVIYVLGSIYLLWSDPTWLTVRISTPVRTILPAVVYSILPLTWFMIRRRQQRAVRQRGFELASPAERQEQAVKDVRRSRSG